MKSFIYQYTLWSLMFLNFGANAQNNLFERTFQKGFLDFDYKFLKKDSIGFVVYTESVGVNNHPYSSYSCIQQTNDSGTVIQQTQLDLLTPQFWERFRLFDWYNSADNNIIVQQAGMGCDYALEDSCLIYKLAPTGNLLWQTNGLPTFVFNDKFGLLRYQNGYLNYNIISNNPLPGEQIKLLYCSENGNTRNIQPINNNNYLNLYSNGTFLYGWQKDNNDNEYLQQIDTLGNIYHDIFIANNQGLTPRISFAFRQNKILFSNNTKVFLLHDTLGLINQTNCINPVIKIEFDTAGNVWALQENGDLLKFDSNLNPVDSINLTNITGNINVVNWFETDLTKNRIYFGGLAENKPFIKSMEAGNFNHFQNSIAVQVTNTQISNATGNLRYLGPTAPVYALEYQFNVAATIKNTGNTVLQKVVLNCSAPLGYYICHPPYLAKTFTGLNLLPGDSLTLNLGIYYDYNVHIWIANANQPYIRSNFCVWPSAPNDSWSHSTFPEHCQDIEISAISGVGLNSEQALNSAIEVFPNPSKDRILVTIPSNFSPSEISIVDLAGSSVLKYYNEETLDISVDVSELSNGIYFLLLSDGEKMARKKFVKLNE